MNYFTKEFYEAKWLADAYDAVRECKDAETKNEKFYRRVYESNFSEYMNNEKASHWYRNFAEEMLRFDKFVDEKDITQEERDKRKEMKKDYAYLWGNREKNNTFSFDEKLCRRRFDELQNQRIEIYGGLPQNVRDKIADLRVFALGYASKEVRTLLRPYCAQLRRTVRQTEQRAYAETDEAESYLSELIGLNDYEDGVITQIEERDGDVLLTDEEGASLVFRGGAITEGNDKRVFSDFHSPTGAWSTIVAAELHRVGELFETHFLIMNSGEYNEEELWDLTIRSTDICAEAP